MFVRIDNTPRDYAWGSTSAIAHLLGRHESGEPEAELWFGAHAGSPSAIVHPAQAGQAKTLAEWIERDPETALGANAFVDGEGVQRLPFLLKVLAAARPLSLQAHPDPEQARTGFQRENEAGIPLDSPQRNYKDPFSKPELIYALSDRFEALCGFRSLADAMKDIDRLLRSAKDREIETELLRELRNRLTTRAEPEMVLRGAVGWLLGGGDGVTELVTEVNSAAEAVLYQEERAANGEGKRRAKDVLSPEELLPYETVISLFKAYPGDPGVAISLLLNRVNLRRGEALYLPAGNVHAYLDGLGIELMSASDNVLRGGLTPKRIDVPELLRVLEFTPKAVPYLAVDNSVPGVDLYRPDVSEFQLAHITVAPNTPAATLANTGPAIVLCIEGVANIAGEHSATPIRRGEAFYMTPEEASVTVTGNATVFVASANR